MYVHLKVYALNIFLKVKVVFVKPFFSLIQHCLCVFVYVSSAEFLSDRLLSESVPANTSNKDQKKNTNVLLSRD